MSNSLGTLFKITSFGESHGTCVGIIIDGCPAGLSIAEDEIQREVDRRRPAAPGTTQRREQDRVEIVSGVFNGFTTGAPLCMLTWNKDVDSAAYEKSRHIPRPGHADYTALMKYGSFNDFRGGGRFSGRITAGFVMAGAVARKLLGRLGFDIFAHTVEIGGLRANESPLTEIKARAAKNALWCADPAAAEEMVRRIAGAQEEKDSLGGIVEGIALNVPAGLGEPVFDRLDGELAKALFAIPAVKGVEFGAGFALAKMRGSESNDPFTVENGRVFTKSNSAGGVLGGISSGMPLVVRVAVKPTASIGRVQDTVDLEKMAPSTIEVAGRHDACIIPRAVPVVEAMMAVVLCDFALRANMIPRVLA
jgi:chorismate synthase